MSKLEVAYAIALVAHKGQVDKAGVDYINHPLAVSAKCNTEKEKIVALLHDVVEDTNVTLEDLSKFFDSEIIEAIDLLTHKDEEDYLVYLSKIKSNSLARTVKIADLENNMDLTRIPNPTEKDYQRLENKYKPAYRFLTEGLKEVKSTIDIIKIVKGDITTFDCDAIVNAANSGLRAGGGVCGAIFSAAGYHELQNACENIGYCLTGNAVITPGFNLKARHVIHAVGPMYYDDEQSAPYLKLVYKNIIKVAEENKLTSIAIPSISTGIYGYPKDKAVKIAVETLAETTVSNLKEIYIVCFEDDIYDLYINEIGKY